MNTLQHLRRNRIAALASAVTATCLGMPLAAHGIVQTYSSVVFAPNTGADHPGFGFFQADFAWDDGIAGEFEFSGSDGAFTMAAFAFGGGGTTGRANDHAAFFQMDYNPNPPTRSFGTFWFGGIGNDIGPLPTTDYSNLLAFADVIAPAGKPYEFRTESDFIQTGHGFKFQQTGTGTWQTIGGVVNTATFFGNFNTADPTLASLVAFGNNGQEITLVDNGTDPTNVPTLMVDNLCLTPAVSSWTSTGGGAWSDNTKWTTLAADGPNATAVFGNTIASASTIDVVGQHFAGKLQIGGTQSYTFAGTGTSSLNIRVVGAGTNGIISVQAAASHTISVPLELWNNTTVDTVAGSSLTVSTLLDVHPGAVVTKTGAGTFSVPNVRAAGLFVNGGTVHVNANGTDAGTSKVNTLTIAGGTTPTATLDLNDNDLVVGSGTPKATIEAQVKNARNNGAWNQPGITSTTARNNGLANTGLGVMSGAEYTSVGGTGTFSGQAYAATDTLVKYTWNGDANFSGTVNFDDYVRIDVGFNTNLTGWVNGDFNYSGAVNFDDYVLIDVAFNTQSGTLGRAIDYLSGDDRNSGGLNDPAVQKVVEHFDRFGLPYASAFLAAVPEPAAGVGLALSMLGVIGGRRRRQR
jgi:hypothetical protein